AVRRADLCSAGIPSDASVPRSAGWLSGTAGSAWLAVSELRPAGVRPGPWISPAARGLWAASRLSELCPCRHSGLRVDNASALRTDLYRSHGASAHLGAVPAR